MGTIRCRILEKIIPWAFLSFVGCRVLEKPIWLLGDFYRSSWSLLCLRLILINMTFVQGRLITRLNHVRFFTQHGLPNSGICTAGNGMSILGVGVVLQTRSTNLLSIVRCLQTTTRQYATRFLKTPRKFKPRYKKDGVSKEYELIYENNMRNYYKWYSVVVYCSIFPSLYIALATMWNFQNEKWENVHIEHPLSLAIPGLLFGLVLLLLCVYVSRRNVIRIYMNAEKGQGVAIVPDRILLTKQLPFSVEDCSRIPPSPVLKQLRGNLRIQNRSFFVVGSDFAVAKDYNDLMGWEIPEDIAKNEIELSKLFKKK
ncbi:hypothetical protein ScPMuIL_000244 [Solemya velum]